jgi:hypothetical protein
MTLTVWMWVPYRQAKLGEETCMSCGAAESGFGLRWKKKNSGAPARADRLKIFTLNRKDWLSVAEWLGAWSERVNLYIRQIMIVPRKTKIYATWSAPGHGNLYQLPLLVGTASCQQYHYCLLLKRMQLTCTAWVESLYTRDKGQGKNIQCKEHESLSLYDLLSTGRYLLDVSFITILMSNLCTALTTYNSTKNNFIISHAQNTTALETNVFLTGIHLSQTRDSRLSPAEATSKVNRRLLGHYQYLSPATGCHTLRTEIIMSLKTSLCTAQTIYYPTENHLTHMHNTRLHFGPTGIHRLVITIRNT